MVTWQARKLVAQLGHQVMKTKPTTQAEAHFWQQGLSFVAGLDEAGRGAWAGPVYAAAVILPQDPTELAKLAGVRDSKQLSPKRRELYAGRIAENAIAVGIGWSTAEEIDHLGIVPATRQAMARALNTLAPAPQALVIDALTLPEISLPQQAFPYADARSLSVAAAGIMAKVQRDRWMVEIAETQYAGYGFAQHKGYGTRQHREALRQLGVSYIHRRTFRPIAEQINLDAGKDSP